MATTEQYLNQLKQDKQTLVDNLNEKGVEASSSETFTTLAPKVLDISGGGDDFSIDDASYLFYNGARINEYDKLVKKFNKVKSFNSWLGANSASVTIPIDMSTIDMTYADDVSYMFDFVSNYTVTMPNFANMKPTKVYRFGGQYIQRFYHDLTLFKDIKIQTSMQGMFNSTSVVANINYIENLNSLNNYDTSNVTDMSNVFANAYIRDTNVNLNWCVNNVKSFNYMFESYSGASNTENFESFEGLYSTTDMSGVTMNNMFNYRKKLKYVDLSNVTATLTSARYMFGNCPLLEKVDIRNLVFPSSSIDYFLANSNTNVKVLVKDETEKQKLAGQNPNYSNCFICWYELEELAFIKKYTLLRTLINKPKTFTLNYAGLSPDISSGNINFEVIGDYSGIDVSYTINSDNKEILVTLNGSAEISKNVQFKISDTLGNSDTMDVSLEIETLLYAVEDVEGASYNFELNDNDFYESNNKKQGNSAALCKVRILPTTKRLYIDCINSSQGSYDYGILSNLDKELTTTYTDDGATGSQKVKYNFKNQSSLDVKEIDYGYLDGQEHFIYIKYRKNLSTDQGNDSLQFQIRFEK